MRLVLLRYKIVKRIPKKLNKQKLKSIQQNRFASLVGVQSYVSNEVPNLNISNQLGYPQDANTMQYMSMAQSLPEGYQRSVVENWSDMEEDTKPKWYLNKENVRRGVVQQFNTTSSQIPPPDVPFIAIDDGQTSPKYMRSTMFWVPRNPTIHNEVQIPMGVVVHPFAELLDGEAEIPTADWGENGPVRWK